jgi:hypothetical protein
MCLFVCIFILEFTLLFNFHIHLILSWGGGVRGGAVGWGTALQAGRSGVRFLMRSLEFFIDLIILAALWPWGWLTQMNAEGSRCLRLIKFPPSCADCPEILWIPTSCSPSGLSKQIQGLLYPDPYLYQLLVADLNVLANSNPRFSSRSLSHFPTKVPRFLRQAAHSP